METLVQNPVVPQLPVPCPHCQTPVAPDAYFCPHCGRKLKEPPPSTAPFHVTALVLAALFLPPAGLFTGFKYLKQPEENRKNIGIMLIALTVISILVTIWFTIAAIGEAENIVNTQLGGGSVLQHNNQPSNSGFIDQQLGL